jgi:hypothetical protein
MAALGLARAAGAQQVVQRDADPLRRRCLVHELAQSQAPEQQPRPAAVWPQPRSTGQQQDDADQPDIDGRGCPLTANVSTAPATQRMTAVLALMSPVMCPRHPV